MSVARVVLWRHGRTAWNAEGRWQGHLDVPLDEVGQEQARAAAAVLAKVTPTALVSSDLARARVTAQALADATGLPVTEDRALREIDGGAWQGLLRAEIEAADPERYAAWRGGEDLPAGGGERRSTAAERVAAAVERHAAHVAADDGAGTLVVVSHGGALGGALLRLLGLAREAAPVVAGLRNAHWTTLVRGGEGGPRWRLLEHNATPR